MNALHIKLGHPSKSQLTSLVQRYFYTPGWRNIVQEITDQCHQCSTVKQLPKILLDDTTDIPQGIGTHMAADVIERNGQKILVVRDKLSQFTRASLIPDQTADTLRQFLLSMVLDILPDSGTNIRVDGATAFQTLERESATNGTLLKQLNIIIEVGRLVNKNKNPVGENAVKEVLKEILRHTECKGQVSHTDLDVIMKNINSRIRSNGLSAKEMMFKRDLVTNKDISVTQEDISKQLQDNRKELSIRSQKSKQRYLTKTPSQSFQIGQLVLLRNAVNKITPRDLYIVEDIHIQDETTYYLVRKMQSSLNHRLYKVLPDELILAPTEMKTTKENSPEELLSQDPRCSLNTPARRPPTRKAATLARQKISAAITSIDHVKPKFKHGWIVEDQDYDDCEPHIMIPFPEDSSIDSTSNPTTMSNTPERHSSTQSPDSSPSPSPQTHGMDELTWDWSPEQYQLQALPPDNTPKPLLPKPPPRNRKQATTDPSLTRSHAFWKPSTLPPLAPKKPRVPTPSSPASVQTNMVNDISVAVSHINTQVFTNSSRPRRSIPRPDYRRLHSMGFGSTAGNKEEGEETKEERSRNHRA